MRSAVALLIGLAACGSFGTAESGSGDAGPTSSSSPSDFCAGWTYCDQFEGGTADFWTKRPSAGVSIAPVDDPAHGKVLEVTRPAGLMDAPSDLYIGSIAKVPHEIELWVSVVAPPAMPGIVTVFGVACGDGYVNVSLDANTEGYQAEAPLSNGDFGRSNVARKIRFDLSGGQLNVTTDDGAAFPATLPKLTPPCTAQLGIVAYNGEAATVHIDDFRMR